MTQYLLSQKYPHSEFLNVEITLKEIPAGDQPLSVRLPAWRPGRYELGNFAKNIRKFRVTNEKGEIVNYKKKSRNNWEIFVGNSHTIKINYEYYTNEINGGSTYVAEDQWYINFINCLLYVDNQLNKKCEVTLSIPDNWKIATGLDYDRKTLFAESFYQLVDSPLIASAALKQLNYEVNNIQFYLWFKGDFQLQDEEQILNDFRKFTTEQLEVMQEFESSSYHFLFQIPDQKAYHGVEHLNSTCIVLGPAKDFNNQEFYDNLLGISSHELFHYWNIIRIRPEELFPYDFTRENYFSTGYVAEGVTTYYGDLFLVRSGVRDLNWYKTELNKLLKRHFDNNGRFNYSVADSSLDMWVDGYEMGTPSRKVSIYVKGAIIAIILDLKIMIETAGERNLDNVLLHLWNDHYKKNKGYSAKEYIQIAEAVLGYDLQQYEKDFIYGTTPVENALSDLLPEFGFELVKKYPENPLTRFFGFKYSESEEGYVLKNIAPESPAEAVFRREDILISINEKEVKNFELSTVKEMDDISFHILRNGKMKTIKISAKNSGEYYVFYEVKELQDVSKKQLDLRKKWLKV